MTVVLPEVHRKGKENETIPPQQPVPTPLQKQKEFLLVRNDDKPHTPLPLKSQCDEIQPALEPLSPYSHTDPPPNCSIARISSSPPTWLPHPTLPEGKNLLGPYQVHIATKHTKPINSKTHHNSKKRKIFHAKTQPSTWTSTSPHHHHPPTQQTTTWTIS